MNDALRRRESREYAVVIMRAARSAKFKFERHQIMLMYNDLDLEFQRDINVFAHNQALEFSTISRQ
jgi:hypothetical protein